MKTWSWPPVSSTCLSEGRAASRGGSAQCVLRGPRRERARAARWPDGWVKRKPRPASLRKQPAGHCLPREGVAVKLYFQTIKIHVFFEPNPGVPLRVSKNKPGSQDPRAEPQATVTQSAQELHHIRMWKGRSAPASLPRPQGLVVGDIHCSGERASSEGDGPHGEVGSGQGPVHRVPQQAGVAGGPRVGRQRAAGGSLIRSSRGLGMSAQNSLPARPRDGPAPGTRGGRQGGQARAGQAHTQAGFLPPGQPGPGGRGRGGEGGGGAAHCRTTAPQRPRPPAKPAYPQDKTCEMKPTGQEADGTDPQKCRALVAASGGGSSSVGALRGDSPAPGQVSIWPLCPGPDSAVSHHGRRPRAGAVRGVCPCPDGRAGWDSN